jgi:hypothetical protein
MKMPLNDSYLAGFRAAYRHDRLPKPAPRGGALDSVPENGLQRPRGEVLDQGEGRGETAEAMLKMRGDIESLLEKLDLHGEVKAAILKCLDQHVRPEEHTRGGPGPRATAMDRAVERRNQDRDSFKQLFPEANRIKTTEWS